MLHNFVLVNTFLSVCRISNLKFNPQTSPFPTPPTPTSANFLLEVGRVLLLSETMLRALFRRTPASTHATANSHSRVLRPSASVPRNAENRPPHLKCRKPFPRWGTSGSWTPEWTHASGRTRSSGHGPPCTGTTRGPGSLPSATDQCLWKPSANGSGPSPPPRTTTTSPLECPARG